MPVLPRPLRRAAVAATVAGTAALAWGSLIEPHWFVVRHFTVPVLRPPMGPPLRVLHLSDLHLQPRSRRLPAFLERCAGYGPDLVVVTGDLLGSPDLVEDAVALLERVRGAVPGLVVLGSHDRHSPRPGNPFGYFTGPSDSQPGPPIDVERLVKALESTGWDVIENARRCVSTPAGIVDAVGLADPHIRLDRPALVDWDTPGEGPPVLRLGVVHAPYRRVLDRYDRKDFDLVLAGHTHGGQVRVPFLGALVDNCDLPVGQARGLSRYGQRLWLHVSAGLGQSRYAPLRFACRPEATVLDLVPARTPAD